MTAANRRKFNARGKRKKNFRKSSNVKRDCNMRDSCEWLPTGWSFEVKTRKGSFSGGRSYKIYIESSTGSRFYSKLQVSRYLGAQQLSSPSVNHDRTILTNSTPSSCNSSNEKMLATNIGSKVDFQFDNSPVGLPNGWIRKIRVCNNRGRLRRDSLYIDPITGYQFRSRKEVSRYLEKGEIGPRVIKSKNRNIPLLSLEKKTNFVGALDPKPRKSVRRCLLSSEVSVEGDATPVNFHLFYPHKNVSRSYGPDEKFYLLYPNRVPQSSSTPRISEAGSSCLTADFTLRGEANDKNTPFENPHPVLFNPNNENLEKAPDPILVLPPASETRALVVAKEESLASLNKSLETNQDSQNMDKSHETENLPSLSRSKKVKAIIQRHAEMPRRASRRLAGLEASTVDTSRIGDRSLRAPVNSCVLHKANNGGSEEKADKSDMLRNSDPGSEINSEDLGRAGGSTGAKSSPSLELLFAGAWSDPCLEFAFKTLTGDIPLDSVVMEPYFRGTSTPSPGSAPLSHLGIQEQQKQPT